MSLGKFFARKKRKKKEAVPEIVVIIKDKLRRNIATVKPRYVL